MGKDPPSKTLSPSKDISDTEKFREKAKHMTTFNAISSVNVSVLVHGRHLTKTRFQFSSVESMPITPQQSLRALKGKSESVLTTKQIADTQQQLMGVY